MNNLEEQKRLLEGNSSEKKIFAELKKEMFSFWGGAITLIVAIAGIVLAFFGVVSVEKSEIITLKTLGAVICASLLSAWIFTWFSHMIIRKIAKNLSETKIKYIDVLETFIFFKKDYEVKMKHLNAQIEQNERISKNISNSPISCLVSWEQSEEYEKESEFVYGITYDLSWINYRIDGIIEEVISKPTHKYFLVLIESNRITKTNERNIKDKIAKAEAKANRVIIDNNIFIRNIQDLIPCPVTKDFPLPLPNDIALYKNIPFGNKQRVAVMSPQGVHNILSHNHNALENGYDIQFTIDEQIDKIEFWFENIWEKITGTKPQ
jgi:hypothetical protein